MADTIDEAYRHCERLVRAHDKDRYLTSLFAPADRRRYLFALYAFALELARVKMLVTEPIVGAIRLQWWHDAIDGLRAEEAAANPVMSALQDAARQTNVSLAPLTAAVEAREAELQGTLPVGAAAVIFSTAARFLGAEGEAIAPAADLAGQAVTLIEVETEKARAAYSAFRKMVGGLPETALPAFLPAALVPLRLQWPGAPQWRRQIVLLRTAWFGFPKI
jgi:phytoene/squalene synthetase